MLPYLNPITNSISEITASVRMKMALTANLPVFVRWRPSGFSQGDGLIGPEQENKASKPQALQSAEH